MAAMEIAARERAPTTVWDAESESLRSYLVGLAGVPPGTKKTGLTAGLGFAGVETIPTF